MKCIVYPQELGKVDHNSIEYVPFRKDFYVEVPEIANMTKEEVEAYRSVSDWFCTSVTFILFSFPQGVLYNLYFYPVEMK